MLKHDWLLTALICDLIGCFRFKLSDLTWPITIIWNWTGQNKQPITIINLFMPLSNKLQLPSPSKIKENFLHEQIEDKHGQN